MSFGYSGSVPICDPSFPHHYNGTNGRLLPHRACSLPHHQCDESRVPLSVVRNSSSITSNSRWQPTRKRAEDSPTVGFYNRPRLGSKAHEPTSGLTLEAKYVVRAAEYKSHRYTTKARQITSQEAKYNERSRERQLARKIANTNGYQHSMSDSPSVSTAQ